MDIDFLMRNQSNENDKVLDMVIYIIDIDSENAFIEFKIKNVASITEHKQYHGFRVKDFYDIYYLAGHYDFDGRKLQEAIFETFSNRGRVYERNTLERVKALLADKQLIKDGTYL